MSINIVFSDSSGGVKTVSEALSAAYTNQGIPHTLLNQKSIQGNRFTRVIKSINIFWKNKNEAFILQHFDAIFFGLLLRLLGFNKLINVVHTDLVEYYESIGFLKKSIVSFVFFLLKKDTIVFVSKEAELKAREKFKIRNTTTIYNIYDFSYIKHIKHIKHIKQGKINFNKEIILGSISRLHKLKNIDLLIRVLKKVRYANPSIKLLIYGSGDEQESLEKYINQQDCSDFVKLLGASNDKQAIYSSLDAMVSFSSIEGFGMTILESIGYGIPVFYTDCSSGPRELMSPATDPLTKTVSYEKTNIGYLVKPIQKTATYSHELDDYEAEYVDIMLAFIDDLKNNRFCMEYDPARFSEKTIVKQWQELIEI